jgi:hypothetical protein
MFGPKRRVKRLQLRPRLTLTPTASNSPGKRIGYRED